MNEKYAVMTPFNIIQKMLGPYMFGPTSRETLGDKMELYFQDYSFVPLFIQVRPCFLSLLYACVFACGMGLRIESTALTMKWHPNRRIT